MANGQLPPLQLEVESASGATVAGMKLRIQLNRNELDRGNWQQITGGKGVDTRIPSMGYWSKDDGTGGTVNGSVWLSPAENEHHAVLILNAVFPASAGKRGSGYFIADAGYSNKGPVQFSILQGERVTDKMPTGILEKMVPITDRRLQRGWVVAVGDLTVAGVGQKYIEFLQDPTNWVFLLGFFGMKMSSSKAGWFLALRSAAGSLIAVAAATQYVGMFQEFSNRAQAATSDAEVDAAGHYLGDALKSLVRDIGIAAFCAAIDAAIAYKKASAPPSSEPTIPVPEGVNLRDWRKALPELKFMRQKAVQAMRQCADPVTYDALARRAMCANILLKSLSRFVLDTIHHIEMVKRAAVYANKLISMSSEMIKKESTSMFKGALKSFTAGEFVLTDEEASNLAAAFLKAYKDGSLKHLKLAFHDIATAVTSKFSAAIAKALSSPMHVPRDLTLEQLEWLAKNKNPDTKVDLTPADFEKYFGEDMAKWREYFGEDTNVAREGHKVKKGVKGHNEEGHHSVNWMVDKPFDLVMEMALDEVHGFFKQLRHYRDGAVNIGTELAKVADWKRPWLKLALACFKRVEAEIGAENVKDPTTVSAATLHAYGQSELVTEFRHVLHHRKK